MESTHQSISPDDDRTERIKKCLELALQNRPAKMPSASASMNRFGDVVIVALLMALGGYTLLIAAWCESGAARRRIQNLNARLPKRMAHDFKNWASWELIWEGDTYELQDLSGNDSRNLSHLLVKTMTKTYEPLKSAVSKV